jgi:hypothetical protein
MASVRPAHLLYEYLHAFLHWILLDKGRDGDGSRVDHGVVRTHGPRVELDGIEGVSAGLDAHVLERLVAPARLERHLVGERLRDGLDRELVFAVPHRELVTVHAHQADAEVVPIGFPQLGDVGSYLSFVQVLVLGVDALDYFLDVCDHADHP